MEPRTHLPRAVRWLFATLLTGVAVVGVLLLLAQTEWGHARLRDVAIRQVASLIDGTLTIGRLDGSLTHDLTLHDVRIERGGTAVFTAKRIAARYHWATFFRPAIVLPDLVLEGAQATVVSGPDGWQLDGVRFPAASTTPPQGAPRTFTIGTANIQDTQLTVRTGSAAPYVMAIQSAVTTLQVDDAISVGVQTFVGLEQSRGAIIDAGSARIRVDDTGVHVTDLRLASSASDLTGRFAVMKGGRIDAALRSRGLRATEVAPYVTALEGYSWRPSFDLTVAGPTDTLTVTGRINDPVVGGLEGRVVVRVGDRVHLSGQTQMTRVNLEPLLRRADMVTRLTGTVSFEVDVTDNPSIPLDGTFSTTLGPSSYTYAPGERYDIERGQARGRVSDGQVHADVSARAYDAETTGAFSWDGATELFRMVGRLAGGRPDRLPTFVDAPPFDAQINGTYVLTVDPSTIHVVGTLEPSQFEGSDIAAGAVADITVVGDDVRYRVSGRASRLQPWRFLPPLEVTLNPTLGAHRVELDTTFEVEGGGPIAEPFDHDFTFKGRIGSGRVDDATFVDVPFDGVMASRRLAVHLSGQTGGDWSGVVGDSAFVWRPVGTFDLTVGLADVSAETYTLDQVRSTLTLDLGPSVLRDLAVRRLQLTGALSQELFTVTEVTASLDAGTVTLSGTVAGDEGQSSDLVIRTVFDDLSALPPTWVTGLGGSATIEGRVTGPWAETRIDGTARSTTLRTPSVRVGTVEATFGASLPNMDAALVRGTLTGQAGLLEFGAQRLTRATAEMTFTADQADVAAVLTHERGALSTRGRVDRDADGNLSFAPVDADLSLPGARWQLARDVQPRLRWLADRVEVQSLAMQQEASRVFVAGTLGLETALPSVQMRASIERLDIAPFAELLSGSRRVTGTLDASIQVTGSVAAPISSSTFTVTQGTADGVPFTSVAGSVTTRDDDARLDVTLDAAERGTASLVGVVPLGESGALDVRVAAGLADVGVIAPAIPYIARASGRAQVDVRVTGSVAEPVVNGSATLSDVAFEVPETGVAYRAMQVEVAAVDSILQVRRFTVEDPQGHVLRINGRLDVLEALQKRGSEAGGDVDLRVQARDFRVLGNTFGELSVNLNLTAAGTLVAPQVLGAVTIERGRFEVDRLLETFVQPYTAAAALQVPAGVMPTRPTPAEPAREHADAPAPPHLFSGAAFSIDLQLPDNVIVRGRGIQTEDGPIGLGDINLTLGGTLQVIKRAGSEASLVGEVNAVRGTYDFQGRRFAIQRGSRLRFRGDDYTDPSLEITAVREIQGVRVTALITGTAMEPELTLRSDPPLDEGDILALVVFNRPINELGEAQKVSLASRAGAMAAGVLAGPIADSVARALDLDVFEIQTAAEGTGGPIVTVGRQVSDRLFVGFRHEFGTEGSNRLTFEYRLTEFLRIVTSVAQGGDPTSRSSRAEAAGIDLIFVIRR